MTPSAFFFRFFHLLSPLSLVQKKEKGKKKLTSLSLKKNATPSTNQQEKNVSSDLLDGRVGRVYVPRQDLADLPSAVMKGAKRERREGKEGGEEQEKKKKKKKAVRGEEE